MKEDYNPNSTDATLSRIETMLKATLEKQAEQGRSIGKLWAALGRLDVRVAGIAGLISGAFWLFEIIFKR